MSIWSNFSNITGDGRRLRQLHEELERLFTQGHRRQGGGIPPLNIWTNDQGAIVTAELPGVDPQTLEITAFKDTLTIKGTRPVNEPKNGQTWHRRDRREGQFTRTIELPFVVNEQNVAARYHDGIFEAELKRPVEQRPKKIAVQAG